MKKTQFEPLVIDDYETVTYPLPEHGHTYYEIIYIHKGSGAHYLNNNVLHYTDGDLFLLCPGDVHRFEIMESTHFTFIKFTDSYFSGHSLHRPDANTLTSPEAIMRNMMLKERKLELPEALQPALSAIVRNIIAYEKYGVLATSSYIFYQVLSIFGMVREVAALMSIRIDDGQPQRERLIVYIHDNIYYPDKLQIHHIGTYFGISPTYFGNYFKRNFGMPYRHYINEYKISLIEERLKVKHLTISKIATEFNFSDESHFSHFFKRLRKITPAQFRLAN